MRHILYLFAIIALAGMTIAGSCSKGGGGGGGGGGGEQTLVVELNPPANSVQAPAPGPDFPLTVTIKSTMPSAGVKIDVSARTDVAGSTPFFTESKNSTSSVNNFTITNSPKGAILRVDVTVTSLSTSTNKFTGSYTYSRK
ncbi:MAG TPA: hypothetical protein VJT83_01920 [Chitinophagaceae bacterium]|nr:hypothetical protein [Chitinophagaceae bacterium]